eukprot:gene16782-biopygen764
MERIRSTGSQSAPSCAAGDAAAPSQRDWVGWHKEGWCRRMWKAREGREVRWGGVSTERCSHRKGNASRSLGVVHSGGVCVRGEGCRGGGGRCTAHDRFLTPSAPCAGNGRGDQLNGIHTRIGCGDRQNWSWSRTRAYRNQVEMKPGEPRSHAVQMLRRTPSANGSNPLWATEAP